MAHRSTDAASSSAAAAAAPHLSIVSSKHADQTSPTDFIPSEADRQLQGLLQQELASTKSLVTAGPSIPRLLSPAPIGPSASSGTSGSGPSSQRDSPVPPPNISRSPLFDLGLQNVGSGNSAPSTPKRATSGISRGLSLQLPTSASDASSSSAASGTKPDALRTPLTPKADPAIPFGSPGSVLPRRSRGMDFSRAATHLHHSTIAEKPDPESSPIVGGGASGRGINMPSRRSGAFDSPMRGGTGPNCGFEQSAISSSVGSIIMMDSGSDSSSEDDVAMRDEDETLLTPQVGRLGMLGLGNGFISSAMTASPGGDALKQFTAADGRNYRDRLRNKGPRKNSDTKRSSNGWRYDWMSNQGFNSPPVHRSIEGNDSYFQREISRRNFASRRESLSLGTDELTIDDSTPDSDQNKTTAPEDSAEGRKNVIKRAVTARRSALIPKSKGFARIRAALMEESAPLDMENRREAEVIRQVREREEPPHGPSAEDSVAIISQPATTASSPCMQPVATAGPIDSPDDMSEINLEGNSHQPSTRRSSSSFSVQATRAGNDFWSRFNDDDRLRTPPPPLFSNPGGPNPANLFSEDSSMSLETSSSNAPALNGPPLWPGTGPNGSRNGSNGSNGGQQHLQAGNHSSAQRTISPAGRTRSNTPTTTAIQTSYKALGKRRRDDELDSEFFKRRAVSPGLSSIAGSPILPPSPAQKENSWWSRGSGDSGSQPNAAGGTPGGNAAATAGKRETPGGHVAGERLGSTGSESGRNQSASRGGRVGMQGMNEAGEGMMNMSIE